MIEISVLSESLEEVKVALRRLTGDRAFHSITVDKAGDNYVGTIKFMEGNENEDSNL